jgi:hypothetical protein
MVAGNGFFLFDPNLNIAKFMLAALAGSCASIICLQIWYYGRH